MAVYAIVKIGDPILREKAGPVKKMTPNIAKLLDNLSETMYDTQGVGLAAPQIGVPKRAIVVDVGEGLTEIVNPEVVEKSDATETVAEGCLSIPGVRGEVERPLVVTVTGLNRDGEPITVEAEGIFARALQHEIDHLEGILFVDKAVRFVE